MAEQDLQSLMRTGVQAARAGNKKKARRIFERVLEIQDDNELAWMWMASVVETLEERRVCLENVLDINPNSTRARKALDQLETQETARKPEPPPPPKPKPAPPPREESSTWAADGWTEKFDTSAAPPPREAPRREESPRPRRRNRSTLILILGAVGVLLVLVVTVVLVLQMSDQPLPAIGPDNVEGTAPTVPPAATATRVVVVNPDELEDITQIPTWTLLPTEVPPVAPTFTATPFPLNAYQLAYARRLAENNEDIYIVSGDGDKLVELVQNEARDSDPAVSPDGQEIVFVSDRAEGPELFVTNANRQGAAVQLTETEAAEITGPAWSPDGTQIVFSAILSEGTDSEIYVILRSDPLKLKALTDNQAIDQAPAWSPDGKTIVFSSDRITRGLFQIFAVPSECFDTSPQQCEEAAQQFTQSQNSNMSPAWSPDGEQIVFVSNRVSIDDPDIYVMRADGTDAQLLTLDQYGDDGAVDSDPAWSPDGRWIAFVSSRAGGRLDIYLMSVDGTDVFPVTETGSVYSPSWFPLE